MSEIRTERHLFINVDKRHFKVDFLYFGNLDFLRKKANSFNVGFFFSFADSLWP